MLPTSALPHKQFAEGLLQCPAEGKAIIGLHSAFTNTVKEVGRQCLLQLSAVQLTHGKLSKQVTSQTDQGRDVQTLAE